MQKYHTSLWSESIDPVTDCIVGNEHKHNVGIGWISYGVITEKDLKKYPRVI